MAVEIRYLVYKLPDGMLHADNIVNGTKSLDSNDYMIYNKTTGALSYDADGNGAGAAKQFATLWDTPTTHPTLIGVDDIAIVAYFTVM